MGKKGRMKGDHAVVVGGRWNQGPINAKGSAIKYISSIIFKIPSQVLVALDFNTGQRMSVWKARRYGQLPSTECTGTMSC
jgi:hypothetical protein